MSEFASVIYRTSNSKVGSTAMMLQPKGPFNRTNKFSDHLAEAGNYQANGLNTIRPAERYHDNAKDWMGKNL